MQYGSSNDAENNVTTKNLIARKILVVLESVSPHFRKKEKQSFENTNRIEVYRQGKIIKLKKIYNDNTT